MTYREQLEMLLQACVATSNAYLEAVSTHGQFNKQIESLRSAWEQAEARYDSCLTRIRSMNVQLTDAVAD